MILRNGKTYEYPTITPCSVTDSSDTCCICLKPYRSNEHISSCSKENIYKHSYHTKCIYQTIQYSEKYIICPYCITPIYKLYSTYS